MLRPHDNRVRCIENLYSYQWFAYSDWWKAWLEIPESKVSSLFDFLPKPHPTLDDLKALAYNSKEEAGVLCES